MGTAERPRRAIRRDEPLPLFCHVHLANLAKRTRNLVFSPGYKLIDGNVGEAGKKVTLPLYLAQFLGQK